jgi:hypothetical protein
MGTISSGVLVGRLDGYAPGVVRLGIEDEWAVDGAGPPVGDLEFVFFRVPDSP